MTFTLPRFSRRIDTRTSPEQSATLPRTETPKPADFLMEVVLPAGLTPIQIPGWTLKLWPQARLGDATLQAHAEDASLTYGSLTDALHAQGIQTLGVVRRRAA